MSYLDKCVVKTNFFLRKLRPSHNLIIFIFSENVYIPVCRADLKKIIESKQKHYIKDTEILETFFKLPNEIQVDISLEKCFTNRNNTMKLELKNQFRIGFDKNERLFKYYSVIPVERSVIDSQEISTFDPLNKEEKEKEDDENEIKTDSESENSLDWNEIKKQEKEREIQFLKQGQKEKERIKNEEKLSGNYSEEILQENNVKCIKKFENFILKEETWFLNNTKHRCKESGLPALIVYYENGNRKEEGWYNNGLLHRDPKVEPSGEINNLPALIYYHENGNKQGELWYQNGERHRENNLPSWILYYKNGNTKEEEWYQNNKLYREGDLPTQIEYHENGNKKKEEWSRYREIRDYDDYRNYDTHRDNGPALIEYYENENGKKKQETWYQNNMINSQNNLPALIKYYENGNKKSEKWYKNNSYHRDEETIINLKKTILPAVIEYYEDGGIRDEKWYDNGINITNKVNKWFDNPYSTTQPGYSTLDSFLTREQGQYDC